LNINLCITCQLRINECGALRGLRERKEKQWFHDVNPIKIGYREVFSRAQVCAAGLVTLLNIELLFMYKEQALESVATPAFKHQAQAVNPAVMRGGARNSKLATVLLRRFFENQAHNEATKGNRLARLSAFCSAGDACCFLKPLSAARRASVIPSALKSNINSPKQLRHAFVSGLHLNRLG
jgi:hypothetical protein